ncbi:kelch-like protein 24 [Diadema antillarum]|uniref:kelch-like protein 24 n=1 Tax=Diadema antillarum TaxID=105358 RepID=UPI003A8625CC
MAAIVHSASCASQQEYVFYEAKHPAKVFGLLNDMRKTGSMTDITVQVENSNFTCHRAILACSSPYFYAMFSNDFLEKVKGVVTLEGMGAEVVDKIIEFSYTSQLTINTSNAQELLEAACHLQYQSIVDACCKFLKRHLNPSTCLGIKHLAETYSCQDLLDAASRYCKENFVTVSEQEDFLRLSTEELVDYVSSDDLNVEKEEVILKACMAWCAFSHDRAEQFHQVLGNVRLVYIKPNVLLSHLSNPIIGDHSKSAKHILAAISMQQQYQCKSNLEGLSPMPRPSTYAEVMVVVSGYGKNYSSIRDVVYYSPDSDKWANLAQLPHSISNFAVSVLEDKIYVTGGKVNRTITSACWILDPSTNTWTKGADLNGARQLHGATTTKAGKMYVIGGENENGMDWAVEQYVRSQDKWTVVTSLQQAVADPAVVSIKEKVYVVGGSTEMHMAYEHIQCYNTTLNSWRILTRISIPSCHFPAVAHGNKIYLMSGFGRQGIKVYDVEHNAILQPVPMCNTERHLFAASSVQGKVVVSGGMDNYQSLSSTEIYDPSTNEWTTGSPMPKALRAHNCGLACKLYLGPPFDND